MVAHRDAILCEDHANYAHHNVKRRDIAIDRSPYRVDHAEQWKNQKSKNWELVHVCLAECGDTAQSYG
jgi:hypothetical protein